MKNKLEDLFVGNISRRKFIERTAAAGLTLPVLGNATENDVAAQIIKRKPAAKPGTPDWTRLQNKIQGQVIPHGGVEYESNRQKMLWNAVKPERFPGAIVRVGSETDVREAIRFARRHKLKVAIRGGGHNWHNTALRQEGLLLDLSGLNQVHVDAEHGKAFVQPGVKGSVLMANLAPHGLAFPIGHCSEVPMSGFLLNGGLGWNYRIWGPSCASIEALDIVNARGKLIRADEHQNADLFWAARGAGPGFFGVVTRFHLKVFPLPRAILMSSLTYRIEDIDKVATWLPQLVRSVPANVEWMCNGFGPSGGSTARLQIVAWAFADTVSDGRKALEAFEAEPADLKALSKNLYQETSVESVFGRANTAVAIGPRYSGDTMWSDTSPQELLSSALAGILSATSGSFVMFHFTQGQRRLQQPDMAFSIDASTYVGAYAIWSDPSQDAANQAWVRTTITSLEPLKVGHYVGESDLTIAPDRAKQCFSPLAWERLTRLKRKYDRDDIFFSYLQHA